MLRHGVNGSWRKSSRSNGNGGNNCVEVAFLDSEVAIGDSKDPWGSALLFDGPSWLSFIEGAKGGEFDL